MAKYLSFNYVEESRQPTLHEKLEAAPLQHAEALLKVYALLETAEKHGLLDILRGAISAEATIIDKVAGYANTPEGITGMRNLMVLGKLFASIDPGLLSQAAGDLTGKVTEESKKKPAGLFSITRRLFHSDVLRGLGIALAALESIGSTARKRAEKQS